MVSLLLQFLEWLQARSLPRLTLGNLRLRRDQQLALKSLTSIQRQALYDAFEIMFLVNHHPKTRALAKKTQKQFMKLTLGKENELQAEKAERERMTRYFRKKPGAK